jgi:hypothetical protein
MLGRDEGSGAISRFCCKKLLNGSYGSEWQLGGEKRLTCQFSPAIRASSRSSVFSRILALLRKKNNVISQQENKWGDWKHTVPSHSYISRFPLVFLEVKVQDS